MKRGEELSRRGAGEESSLGSMGRLGYLFFVDLLASSDGRCGCGIRTPWGLREGRNRDRRNTLGDFLEGRTPRGEGHFFSKEGRSPESEAG